MCKSFEEHNIIIDSEAKELLTDDVWNLIYSGFYCRGNTIHYSRHIIKKISLGDTGKYKVVIKWLYDLSGIELILNRKYFVEEVPNLLDKKNSKKIRNLFKSIMVMSRENIKIKGLLENNYRQYINSWNKFFIYIKNYEYNIFFPIFSFYSDMRKDILRLYLKEINIAEKDQTPQYIYVSTYPNGKLYKGEDKYIEKMKTNIKNGNYENVFHMQQETRIVNGKQQTFLISVDSNDKKCIDIQKWLNSIEVSVINF